VVLEDDWKIWGRRSGRSVDDVCCRCRLSSLQQQWPICTRSFWPELEGHLAFGLGHAAGWELDIEAVSRVEWIQSTVVDE
jgi:hypothetical protein